MQITTRQGETLAIQFNADIDPAKDALLFVIRDTQGTPLFKQVLTDGQLSITHEQSEAIPPGAHNYGVAAYIDAVYEEGYPVGGTVVHPIASARYIVQKAEAHNEGN